MQDTLSSMTPFPNARRQFVLSKTAQNIATKTLHTRTEGTNTANTLRKSPKHFTRGKRAPKLQTLSESHQNTSHAERGHQNCKHSPNFVCQSGQPAEARREFLIGHFSKIALLRSDRPKLSANHARWLK